MGFKISFNTISLVLLLISLAFLIMATISSPVTTSLKIAETEDYVYGIFGYCKSSGNCLKATYPYTPSSLDKDVKWILLGSTRDNLAKTFIIAPIAAGITFIAIIFTILSHCFFRGIVALAIVFNILSFIASTLICIFVIIVFHPKVSWTGWILVGSAAAGLLAIPFNILTLKYKDIDDMDDDSETKNIDLTKFDETFDYPKSGGFTNLSNKFDETSSISRDYEYKHNPSQQINIQRAPSSISDSSFYDSKQQSVHDFTVPNVSQSGKDSSGARVNMVNGPNTPIQSKRQMAPHLVPNMATPTVDDVPHTIVPQPPQGRSQQPLQNRPYNPTDLSVFEHHPKVDGHEPFSETPYEQESQNNFPRSDEGDSDLGSDFTSVSQRAANPAFSAPAQPLQDYSRAQTGAQYSPPYKQAYQQPYQQPYQQQYQPSYQQQYQSMAHKQNQYYQPQSAQPQFKGAAQPRQRFYPGSLPMQPYGGSYRMPQMASQARPTISDNVISNNPDFSLGIGAPKRKPGQKMNLPAASQTNFGAYKDNRFGFP